MFPKKKTVIYWKPNKNSFVTGLRVAVIFIILTVIIILYSVLHSTYYRINTTYQ